MVTDKRIINAINGIKNKKLRDVLARGFDNDILSSKSVRI